MTYVAHTPASFSHTGVSLGPQYEEARDEYEYAATGE